jgi:hypothetical protein
MSTYNNWNTAASLLPMRDMAYRQASLVGYADGLQRSGVDLLGARDQKKLSVKRSGNDAVLTTPGGYTINASSRDKAEGGYLEITSPDGKQTTKVWGDPHVDKVGADGSTTRQMDFSGRTTFTLPDNTVITMDVKDKMLSGVAVTNGDQGVLMQGMLDGKDKLNVEAGYGPMLDAMVGDGNVMHMGKDGDFYMDNEFGGQRKATQDEVNRREEMLNGGFGDNLEASDQISMKDFFSQLQSFMNSFGSGFTSMATSGSFAGGLSSNSSLGLFGLDLDSSTGFWN